MAEYAPYDKTDDDHQSYILGLADVQGKRTLLERAVGFAGNANRAAGAATDPDIDELRFGGNAVRVAERNNARGIEEIGKACGQCALRDMCPLNPDELMIKLRDASQNRRRTLRNRLDADSKDIRVDDVLCDDYLAPGRRN